LACTLASLYEGSKSKSFFSAFQALFNKDDVNDDSGNECNNDNQNTDALADNEAKEDLRGFLSVVGSLKQ
jgi:hypothetical protein